VTAASDALLPAVVLENHSAVTTSPEAAATGVARALTDADPTMTMTDSAATMR
jgi:hypothetical protein